MSYTLYKDTFYFLLNTTVFNLALKYLVHMPNKRRTFLYYIDILIYNIYTIYITTSYLFKTINNYMYTYSLYSQLNV